MITMIIGVVGNGFDNLIVAAGNATTSHFFI